MKYGELNLGQIEALVNKFGGMEGVGRFLSGEIEVKWWNPKSPVLVDLDAEPKLPTHGQHSIAQHTKQGKVLFEKRNDGHLYVDGKKVSLRQHAELQRRYPKEVYLEAVFGEDVVLNDTARQFLWEHIEFLPEFWKHNENGISPHIFFSGTIHADTGARHTNHLIFCLYWGKDHWVSVGNYVDNSQVA